MFWTLEGNKTGPCGCVCLVGARQPRVGRRGPGKAPEQDGAGSPSGRLCWGAPWRPRRVLALPGLGAGAIQIDQSKGCGLSGLCPVAMVLFQGRVTGIAPVQDRVGHLVIPQGLCPVGWLRCPHQVSLEAQSRERVMVADWACRDRSECVWEGQGLPGGMGCPAPSLSMCSSQLSQGWGPAPSWVGWAAPSPGGRVAHPPGHRPCLPAPGLPWPAWR